TNVVYGIRQFAIIQSGAPVVVMEVGSINVLDAKEIERAFTAFARFPNGGLIVTASSSSATHRETIISLAAQYRLPAVYYRRYFVVKGGLVFYGYHSLQQ